MDRSNLPAPPAGCCWKVGTQGRMWLYGRYQLPDGRKVERNTNTTSVPVARRRYCRMAREIALAYGAGCLDQLIAVRATRSDKGKKKGPRVKQSVESET